MRLKATVAILVALFIVAGGAQAQYGGVSTPSAQAQVGPVPLEKGVKTSNLVTSLGGFRGTGNITIVITGQIVEIAPGGQTGRQRHIVQSYLYILEGTLVTNSEGGPIGTAGVQYHSQGQSYMDAPGVWHNHSNTSSAPVRYLLLLINTPGGPTTQKATADD